MCGLGGLPDVLRRHDAGRQSYSHLRANAPLRWRGRVPSRRLELKGATAVSAAFYEGCSTTSSAQASDSMQFGAKDLAFCRSCHVDAASLERACQTRQKASNTMQIHYMTYLNRHGVEQAIAQCASDCGWWVLVRVMLKTWQVYSLQHERVYQLSGCNYPRKRATSCERLHNATSVL